MSLGGWLAVLGPVAGVVVGALALRRVRAGGRWRRPDDPGAGPLGGWTDDVGPDDLAG